MVIIQATQEPEDFISTIFLRPKKDGTHRSILNLKAFNKFIAYNHFKMDTLEAAVNMMKPGWQQIEMRFLKLSYPGAIIFLVLEWILVVATVGEGGGCTPGISK